MKSGEIQRAIHVLREHTADSDHVVAVIETATFLLRGGVHDQALGLVSGTEPFIEHPAEAMGALGEFFAADPGFGELWPSARGRLKNAFTEYVESGAADGLGSQYVGDVVTALQKTQRAAEAVDLSSWALPVAAKTQNPRETLFTLCDNAVSLFCCERFEESALVLESVHQRAREAGDAEAMGWAVNYLRDFGVFSGLPAYAQALERLR